MTTPNAESSHPGQPVWFITGCSTGFGRELAKQVLQSGFRAVITARNADKINSFATLGDALILKLNVTDQHQVDAAVEESGK
jgi:NADP-dependent 3-hydroxy acid dehydrogenase YdfG